MSQVKSKDAFFGLRYIAYCRTGLLEDDDLDRESLINFARWQVCKVRNILWNDPIWDRYTPEEVLIEYLSIRFDEDPELRKTFGASIASIANADLEWIGRMERRHLAELDAKKDKINEGDTQLNTEDLPKEPEPPQDYEDTF